MVRKGMRIRIRRRLTKEQVMEWHFDGHSNCLHMLLAATITMLADSCKSYPWRLPNLLDLKTLYKFNGFVFGF